MTTENQREIILTEEFNKLRYDVEKKLLISKENNISMYENWTKKIVDYHNEISTIQSDIDLLVEIDISDAVERGEKLMSLWDKLELFFKRKVDLLTNSSIKNPYLRKSIDQTKVLIYDGKRDQVFI